MSNRKKPFPQMERKPKPTPKMWTAPELSPKARSIQGEERLSEMIGFVCTPGSGNKDWPGAKGDGAHPIFMFECKETKRNSIRVAGKDIQKLVAEAAMAQRYPALVLSAYGLPGVVPKDWVCVPAEVFRWMLDHLRPVGPA